MGPVEMDLLGSLVEVGNGLIDRELNAELAAILMDFSFHLIASVVTLQFVGSERVVFSSSGMSFSELDRFSN